jgi:hypothetical protein
VMKMSFDAKWAFPNNCCRKAELELMGGRGSCRAASVVSPGFMS